jgi:hypothetical protein
MLDWVAFNQGISCAICAGNIRDGTGTTMVRGPASAYNGVAVGKTTANFTQVAADSATAFTSNGRMKPDVVGPGTLLTLANDDWEGAAPDWDGGLDGCSFATPLVAGLMAQQIEAGETRGLSTDPLVIKATLMNSSQKVRDKQSNPWSPSAAANAGGIFTATRPLDDHSGAGQVDGQALAAQYLAGEKSPGLVSAIGWDMNSLATGQFVDYAIGSNLVLGSTLSATLTWYRHVGRSDNGNGIIDAADNFFAMQAVSDLDLQILRNGTMIAESTSNIDNVEHLYFTVDQAAQYTLRVTGPNVFGGDEPFALAWHAVPIPEPAGSAIAAAAALSLILTSSRCLRPDVSPRNSMRGNPAA